MIKRIVCTVLALLVLCVAGFIAVGGRPGVMLLYGKHVLRKDHGPSQEVVWQQGPAVAAATTATPTRAWTSAQAMRATPPAHRRAPP